MSHRKPNGARQRRFRHYHKQSMLRCPPPCGKIQGYSETEAWKLAEQYYLEKGGEAPRRVYACKQTPGVWHWTRMETYSE